jgi:signal peptidase II
MTDLAFTYLFSGEICSTVDKIFWGGSLDYVLVEGFFIFDLKDVYLSLFDAIVVLCLIFNYKGFRKFDEKIFFREFKNYIKVKVYNRQK